MDQTNILFLRGLKSKLNPMIKEDKWRVQIPTTTQRTTITVNITFDLQNVAEPTYHQGSNPTGMDTWFVENS